MDGMPVVGWTLAVRAAGAWGAGRRLREAAAMASSAALQPASQQGGGATS